MKRDGPHSLIWGRGPGLWGSCRSHLGVLVLVHLGEGGAHVVKVDPEIADRRLGVVVAVELGDRLDRDFGAVEPAAEGPPEGVVGELEPGTVADLVDHRAVQAVASLGVEAACGAVVVVPPDEELLGDLPGRVVGVDLVDDLVAPGDPALEDGLGLRVERDAPPLALPLALAADGDVAPAGVGVEVDVGEAQPADLGDPEPEAELEVDDYLLERGLLHPHEVLGLLVGKPVDVGADVLAEVDAHSLNHRVGEVREIPPEDVEVPVLGGDCEVALLPEPDEELDGLLVVLAGVIGVAVVLHVPVDLVEDAAVLGDGVGLAVLIGDGDVLVDARYSGVVALCHGCHSLHSEVVEGVRLHAAHPGLDGREPLPLLCVEDLEREVPEEDAQGADMGGPVHPPEVV